MESAKSIEALYTELGTTLFEAKRYDEASEALLKALAEPETGLPRARTYLVLGKTYSAAGKESDAKKAFENAVRVNAEILPDVEEELLKVIAATTEQPKPAGLFSRFQNLVSSFFRGPLISNMALSLYKNQKYANAETLFRYITIHSPKNADAHEYLGWSRLKQGKDVESVEAFLRAEELDNQRASVYHGLGEAYLSEGQNEKAIAALDKALKLQPDEPDILNLAGVALRQSGKLEESEAAFRHITELQPDNYGALHELAVTLKMSGRNTDAAAELTKAASLLLQKKQYEETARLAQEAVELDVSNADAHLHLARARIGEGHYDEALLILNEAARLLPSDPDIYIISARASFLMADLQEALKKIDKALELMPESAEALGIKGAIKWRLKEYQESLALLDQSLRLDEAQAEFHTERGHVLEALENEEEAIKAYRRATDLEPANRWAKMRLGMLLANEELYEEAASTLEQALKLAPGEDEAFYSVAQLLKVYSEADLRRMRGAVLFDLNRPVQALPELERALELEPDNARACHLRGATLINLHRYQEAVNSLQLAVDLYAAQDVENAEVYADLGEALRASGKYKEAKTTFKQALNLEPEYQWVLARLGETLRALAEFKDALDHLKKAVEADPEDGWAWGALGATHLSLTNYRSALEAFDRTLQLSPEDSFALAYKGKVLRQVERLQQAAEFIDKALEREPEADWIVMEKALLLRQMPDQADKEAIKYFRRAVELRPESGYSLSQLAISLYYLGEYTEALLQVDKAIKFDSTLNMANCLKSLILEKAGQTEGIEETENRFLELFTGTEAYFERSLIYTSLALYGADIRDIEALNRAVRDLKKVIELDDKFDKAYNSLAWIHMHTAEPDWPTIMKWAKRATDLTPEEGSFQDTLGWIYFKQNMFKEALPLLEKAAELNREDLIIEDHLKECQRRIDDKQAELGVSSAQ
ncbi:MAG TPA: tetratricopeptide repeat protein [Pyrinomonadaceae bacterium]|nr:tetratricopeptide repeat protein [Pyrinomonadaceae bacterium]